MSTPVLSNAPNGAHLGPQNIEAIMERYNNERDKRLRSEGTHQYSDLASSEKFKHLAADPWVNEAVANTATPDPAPSAIQDGARYEFLIVGAGYTGLLNAARLIEAGVNQDDIRMVDSAGGFGGTWYWNRYPGLMCDVESYIYMPLVEEMGYMPKHKYSYGPELRMYAEKVAERYNLTDKALFGSKVTSMIWDDDTKDWVIRTQPATASKGADLTFRAHFILLNSGLLNWPKIPKLPGMDVFTGHMFHTSRWDYDYTGGSEDDQTLYKLKDKAVCIVGTGATAIQIVPELARYAKHVYVAQRTPSAIDRRDQRATNSDWWASATSVKGWQNLRRRNFALHISDVQQEVDLVKDGWTGMPSYSCLAGTPKTIPPEKIPEHITYLHNLDLPRSDRVRARVDEVVRDKDTAEKLKAWYPGWCKRPCFHDEYLQSFNQTNVTLIDTNGKGLDGLSESGFLFGGREYPIDLLVLSTGYQPPVGNTPGGYAHATILGQKGLSLERAWEEGPRTLHGISTRGFPNLFFFGLSQTGISPNFTASMDALATHVAYIITRSAQKIGSPSGQSRVDSYKYPFTVQPTANGEAVWTNKIVELSPAGAGMGGCTPGYFNQEGEVDKTGQSPKELLKLARSAVWGKGLEDFKEQLQIWRDNDVLEGLEVLPL